jgi:thiamine-phosphate pyrophosphorylase
MQKKKISTLYFLTPQPYNHPHFFKLIKTVLENGVDWIQYRDKKNDDVLFTKIAKEVFALCKKHNATFIVNDKVEIAKCFYADGVHVCQQDLSLVDARKILGDKKIIGVSTNNLQQIFEAQKNGADYIGLGPFQFTATRENLNPIVGLNGYETVFQNEIYQKNPIELVAIGGIDEENILALKNVGVKNFAISSAIFLAENPTEKIKKLKALIQE